MDSVFRVVAVDGQSETYILEDWGSADEDSIKDWEKLLKAGVTDENGIVQPVCQYDLDHPTWSGRLIVDSILVKLWEELEKI